jgi:hypothetical protein
LLIEQLFIKINELSTKVEQLLKSESESECESLLVQRQSLLEQLAENVAKSTDDDPSSELLSQYYEFLKSIAKWNRGEISAPFEELPPNLRGFVPTIRKFFLERRPQILITNNSGLRTEVIKSNTSLPRPGICPYEHKPDHVCDLCHSLRKLDIESFIKKEDDAITAFAKLGGERLPLAPIAVDDEEEVFMTADSDSDSLLEDSEEDWG